MSTSVVLSLGSNCSSDNVSAAVEWLSSCLESAETSDLYKTPSVSGYGSPYVNAVARGVTELDYLELNNVLKQYEINCGRDEKCRQNGIVPIDIDIVIWDNRVVRPRDFIQQFFQIGYTQIGGEINDN